MKIGIFSLVTDESIGPAELGSAIEERGFESLFVSEHSHIPVAFDTPVPGNAKLPHDYYRGLDPFITLAFAAAATQRIRVGTAISLIAQRDPIFLAKEVASLDLASGGRFELGVGAGWLREEMRNHGIDPRTRISLQSETLSAMKEIWTQEEAEYHGKHLDFDPIFSWPKPVQSPWPPILIGGWGPTTLQRVLDHADGWLAPVNIPVPELERGVRELQALADRHGRGAVPVTATVMNPERRDLESLAELGIHRTLLRVAPSRPHDATLVELDNLAELSRGL